VELRTQDSGLRTIWMPTVDDTVIAVADVYASALLNLTEAAGTSAAVRDELAELAAYIAKDQAFRNFLESPAVDSEARKKTLEKLFRGRVIDVLLDTLQVMNAKGRSGIVPTLHERFRLLVEAVRGEVDVHVTTAAPLSEELRTKLLDVLRRHTGKKPELIERVEPNLIGGLVVRVGDEKIDGSVAHKLATMRGSLLERASREIHSGKQYFEGVAV